MKSGSYVPLFGHIRRLPAEGLICSRDVAKTDISIDLGKWVVLHTPDVIFLQSVAI